MVLDLRKLYVGGLSCDLFKAIDLPIPSESEVEVDICEQVLRANPNHFEALVLLGDNYTRRGEYAKGLELDLRLSRIKPENKLIRYNLACSYALTGEKEKALSCLNKAVELGYDDVEHLRQDRDLEGLKGDPRFLNIVKKLASTQHQVQDSF
jgi:tetratricopeptide (TPR) repeat protein